MLRHPAFARPAWEEGRMPGDPHPAGLESFGSDPLRSYYSGKIKRPHRPDDAAFPLKMLKPLPELSPWFGYLFPLGEEVRIGGLDREVDPAFIIDLLDCDWHLIAFFHI